jgi:hypothetical protein
MVDYSAADSTYPASGRLSVGLTQVVRADEYTRLSDFNNPGDLIDKFAYHVIPRRSKIEVISPVYTSKSSD